MIRLEAYPVGARVGREVDEDSEGTVGSGNEGTAVGGGVVVTTVTVAIVLVGRATVVEVLVEVVELLLVVLASRLMKLGQLKSITYEVVEVEVGGILGGVWVGGVGVVMGVVVVEVEVLVVDVELEVVDEVVLSVRTIQSAHS